MKCPTCGGYHAYRKGWVGSVVDGIHLSGEHWWCAKCGDHVSLTKEERMDEK